MILYKILKKLIPRKFRDLYREAYVQKVAAIKWYARHFRGLPAYPEKSVSGYHLHLGCGSLELDNFINVDLRPFPHVHHRSGVDSLSFIEDGKISLLYVSHCLEHIEHCKVRNVMQEWNRVVLVGGLIYIAVPDFDALLKVYQMSAGNIRSIQGVLMGGQDYAQNFHFTTFNEKFLSDLLEDSGFHQVRRWCPSEIPFGPIQDCSSTSIMWNGAEIPISLNLCAVKCRNL